MIKNISKRGITLLTLVLTIIISLILVTASVGTVTNIISNNRMTSFLEEITQIENQAKLYYIQNNSIPSNQDAIQKSEIYEYINLYNNAEGTTKFIEQLDEEFLLNNDNNTNTFYILDLAKVGVDVKNTDDKYVIAYPSFNVYYLNGIGYNGKNYFSNSSRLSSKNNLENEEVSIGQENIITTDINGMKITKKNGVWSNKLGITITTNIENGENLYIAFNGKEVLLETKEGENTISFDTLLSDVEGGIIASSDTEYKFDEQDIEKISDIRYIEILKKNSSGEVISKNKINIFNFDGVLPILKNNKTEINSLEEGNQIILYTQDLQSGVKEIRYEYFTTYDRIDGKTGSNNYYVGNEINKEYLQYNGKIAQADNNGKITISLPKGVSSIKLVVVDNALNISNEIEISTIPQNSIYYSVNSFSEDSISILFYGEGISDGTVMYGPNTQELRNNTNWEAGKLITLNQFSNIKDKICLEVKSGETTRIINLDIPSKTKLGTKLKEESKWNNPYIPNGFIHTQGTVEEGFVIQDISNSESKYNEFVWVPVDNSNVKFGKQEFGIGIIASFQNVLIDNINSFNESSTYANQIEESVKKYGGFYVARYEASKDESGNVRSIKSANVWNNISYADALLKCNLMYEKSDVKTTIMTASTYDTIIKWLGYSKHDVTKQSDTNNLIGNFGSSLILTGSNVNYSMNNIYDIAGNIAELTSETYKGYPVFRGGSYSSTEENRVAAVRAYNEESHTLDSIGFRPIMYII